MSRESHAPLQLELPPEVIDRLRLRAEATGVRIEQLAEEALRRELADGRRHNTVYVSAPVNALLEGIYQEDTTVGAIRQRGDFGLGTFNQLDGEMVVLDGRVFQLKSDGRAYAVDDEERTPFACVTFFSADSSERIERPLDYAGLNDLLPRMLPSLNMLYAIRIQGHFDYVRTRSVPRQESYRPLVEVAREQPEFEFHDLRGTLAGFWTPEFMSQITVPGYHLHFLTDALDSGGHLLECRTCDVEIAIQHVPSLELGLPVTLDYLTAEFTRNAEEDLEEAER
ncbi:acetolactate decarboxylase [Endothiovibrio diazotrophicus]